MSPTPQHASEPELSSASQNSDAVDNLESSSMSIVHHRSNHDTKLVLWQGIVLLTADCMGVGVLGLPNDIHVLGWAFGLGFLVGNLPINYYAGNLLSVLALDLEQDRLYKPASAVAEVAAHTDDGKSRSGILRNLDCGEVELHSPAQGEHYPPKTSSDVPSSPADPHSHRSQPLHPMEGQQLASSAVDKPNEGGGTATDNPIHIEASSLFRSHHAASSGCRTFLHHPDDGHFNEEQGNSSMHTFDEETFRDEDNDGTISQGHDDSLSSRRGTDESRFEGDDKMTSDLINISEAVFVASPAGATCVVKALYYTNLFLVLGDYILVMGRSISAVFLDQICLPTAGIIATVLMFGLCQYRSMANLGRSVSLASLLALMIVLILCLFHHRNNQVEGRLLDEDGGESYVPPTGEEETPVISGEATDDASDIWGKFSSLAGIGFAVGSQKLFLNIRHELRHREEATHVLLGSLTCYGLAYVVVILLAGPDPPSFLFDAIPIGWNRRLAGLLLWFHVAVSFAINCQALCASLDQVFSTRVETAERSRRSNCIDFSASPWWLRFKRCVLENCDRASPGKRWFGLTLAVCVSSYLVSNAIPFFKDLVGLIGALTSVPLTLTLPALLHRKAQHIRILFPTFASMDSYSLVLYSLAFLGIGLAGAISSIDEDWLNHGSPFSCR